MITKGQVRDLRPDALIVPDHAEAMPHVTGYAYDSGTINIEALAVEKSRSANSSACGADCNARSTKWPRSRSKQEPVYDPLASKQE
jgi:hypothetical protein